MTPSKILVVDDEVELTEILSEYLLGHGYAVQVAGCATQARVLITAEVPDLAILDVRMPGEDGLTLARWIRETHPGVGILMLTTVADVVDRVVGLELGADDYLAKPFDLRELLARSRSVMRRRGGSKVSTKLTTAAGFVHFGKCRLQLASRQLYDRAGQEVSITAMEFDLLRVFADRPNAVLSRDQLMELAHHREWDVFDRSIDLRIMRLRRKIEDDPEKPEVIKTIRGVGYMYILPHGT